MKNENIEAHDGFSDSNGSVIILYSLRGAASVMPAVLLTNSTWAHAGAAALLDKRIHRALCSLFNKTQAGIRRSHPMTSTQAVNTSRDAPSDSNQSCQSISPSKLLLSDTTCSRSSSDRQSPPKSAKRKRAEEILEKKFAQRGKGGPAREMIGVSSRHESVRACSSSERSCIRL